jgi:hypothetical protein
MFPAYVIEHGYGLFEDQYGMFTYDDTTGTLEYIVNE